MKNSPVSIRTSVNFQPRFQLVDLFEEQVGHCKRWQLPFNMISLCLADDPQDPSWVELPEKNLRSEFREGLISFTTCNTPLTLRYTLGEASVVA